MTEIDTTTLSEARRIADHVEAITAAEGPTLRDAGLRVARACIELHDAIDGIADERSRVGRRFVDEAGERRNALARADGLIALETLGIPNPTLLVDMRPFSRGFKAIEQIRALLADASTVADASTIADSRSADDSGPQRRQAQTKKKRSVDEQGHNRRTSSADRTRVQGWGTTPKAAHHRHPSPISETVYGIEGSGLAASMALLTAVSSPFKGRFWPSVVAAPIGTPSASAPRMEVV
jgi:hypothetical protein